MRNIFEPSDESDAVERAKQALSAVRQYQQDWQELGVERAYKYFDDVEGDWLDAWQDDDCCFVPYN